MSLSTIALSDILGLSTGELRSSLDDVRASGLSIDRAEVTDPHNPSNVLTVTDDDGAAYTIGQAAGAIDAELARRRRNMHTVGVYLQQDPSVQVEGTRWPSDSGGKGDHCYVETDGESNRFNTDRAAALAILQALHMAGELHRWTLGFAMCCGALTPYIDPIPEA